MDGRLDILILADHAFAEGGAPQVAIASALALARRGHRVTYLHAVGREGAPALDGVPNLTRIGLGDRDVWDKPPLAAARDGIWNPGAARALAAELARRGEEEGRGRRLVAHVHQWTRGFSASAFAALRARGLPIILSLHDYFIACPTGLKFRFERGEPCALRPLSAACLAAPCDPRSRAHKAIRIARTLAAARALRGADVTAIHVSEASRGIIGADLPADWRQFVVENPIAIKPAPGPRAHAGGKLAYCGRLTAEKGVLLVARAAKAAGMPALFLGEGPMRAAILAENPEAEITGWLPRDEVRARLAAEARCLAAPSLWPETGPMVVAEAQALGIPVIVSDRAGAAARVRDGVDGLVIAPDPAALAAALARLGDESTTRAMGEAAWRAFTADPPGPDAHAARLEAIYRAVLAARQAS